MKRVPLLDQSFWYAPKGESRGLFDREIRAKKTHSLEHTRANNDKVKTNVQEM